MAEVLGNIDTSKLDEKTLTRICELAAKNDKQGIRKLLNEHSAELGMEPLNAGIIRTRKGALMVRVGDTRWPIAMYKNDWKILLSKVDAIREALDKLEIADENPSPMSGAEREAA